MRKYIESIKAKPEHVRRKVALVFCGVVGLILITIFFFVTVSSFGEKNKESSGSMNLEKIKKTFNSMVEINSK